MYLEHKFNCHLRFNHVIGPIKWSANFFQYLISRLNPLSSTGKIVSECVQQVSFKKLILIFFKESYFYARLLFSTSLTKEDLIFFIQAVCNLCHKYWIKSSLLFSYSQSHFPYDRRSLSIVLQPSPFFPTSYLIFLFTTNNNGTNKKSIRKMSKDELIDEVLSPENFKNDINSKFSELNDRFNNFEARYEMVNSNLSITRCRNELLLGHITQLERNKLNNEQYNRKENL